MKVTSITYERREVIMLRRRGFGANGFCSLCRSGLVDLDSAVTLLAIDTRRILGLIDCGSIHAVETASGHLRLCRTSLEKFTNGEME